MPAKSNRGGLRPLVRIDFQIAFAFDREIKQTHVSQKESAYDQEWNSRG